MEADNNKTRDEDISVTNRDGDDLSSATSPINNIRPESVEYFQIEPSGIMPYTVHITVNIAAYNVTDVSLYTNDPTQNIPYNVIFITSNVQEVTAKVSKRFTLQIKPCKLLGKLIFTDTRNRNVLLCKDETSFGYDMKIFSIPFRIFQK